MFGAPISTPIESFYLETNSIPIRFILMGRRLMYLWTILSRDDSDLVKKVYNTQKLLPIKNDWESQVKQDLQACKIMLSDDDIKNMKKFTFKSLVKSRIKNLSNEYLISFTFKIFARDYSGEYILQKFLFIFNV